MAPGPCSVGCWEPWQPCSKKQTCCPLQPRMQSRGGTAPGTHADPVDNRSRGHVCTHHSMMLTFCDFRNSTDTSPWTGDIF